MAGVGEAECEDEIERLSKSPARDSTGVRGGVSKPAKDKRPPSRIRSISLRARPSTEDPPGEWRAPEAAPKPWDPRPMERLSRILLLLFRPYPPGNNENASSKKDPAEDVGEPSWMDEGGEGDSPEEPNGDSPMLFSDPNADSPVPTCRPWGRLSRG